MGVFYLCSSFRSADEQACRDYPLAPRCGGTVGRIVARVPERFAQNPPTNGRQIIDLDRVVPWFPAADSAG